MSRIVSLGALIPGTMLLGALLWFPQEKPGYTDTPRLPGQTFRVHDAERPHPKPVVAGAVVGQPPSDAIILFDGRDLSAWRGRGGEAAWKVEDGQLVVNGTGDIETKESFRDFQLHVEWCTPTPARGSSQGRGNSGIFLSGRYEVQVLDSFENVTYADGQAGALYGQFPPEVNASRAPGVWQSYDILFRAPRFPSEGEIAPAMVTVLHNGVSIHHGAHYLGGTAHRTLPKYESHGDGPIRLQDHGDPVRYRNIWLRRTGE